MASEKSPAFQFYVRDWRSSRRVQVMSFAQRGMYLEMLIEQWDKGAAPSSAGACALALGGSQVEWTRAWAALSACFTPRKRDGLLVNPKLEAVRRGRVKFLKAQSASGLAGAEARWRKHGGAMGSPESVVAKNASSSASASSSALASATASSSALKDPGSLKEAIFQDAETLVNRSRRVFK